ncbi:MAG: hypothetical protein ACYSO2_07200 [Planctomycetota bacterium]|jgi:hypothetical protein
MSDKLKKFLVVIFLTLLIWAWAYMSLAQSETFTGTLAVSPSADPGLLVTLTLPNSSPQTEIPLTALNFKGAPSRISDLSKRNNRPLNDQSRERLDFYYDPQENDGAEGPHTLNLLRYLQDKENSKIHELALTLESCTPPQVTATIEQLEKKELPIQCLDENSSLIKEAVITPSFANIYVRKGYNGKASISLTQQQIENARKQPITATPYVELGVVGVIRKSAEPVEVVLQSETLLKPRTFKTTKPIGVFMSQELQNAYKVAILNDEKVRETMSIYATDEAFRAYESVAYPLYIVIKDSDVVDLSEIPPKTIFYNFPHEYVKSGQIEQDATKLPRTAEITIEPLNPEAE